MLKLLPLSALTLLIYMLKIYQLLLLLILALLMTGCAGGGGGNAPITLAGDNPLRVKINSAYTDPGTTLGTGESNTVEVDSSRVNTSIPGRYTVTYTYLSSNKLEIKLTRTVIVGADPVADEDPLYKHQWHLNNTGQTSFSNNPGVAGEDINIDGVVTKNGNLNGEGIKIAVLDTGLELNHEDLKNNIISGGSRDFTNGTDNPTSETTAGDHGTSVAGIIAAEGWNGKGGRGVAPRAKLAGFNLLKYQTTEAYIFALGGAEYSKGFDIFNQSYGVPTKTVISIDSAREAQYRLATRGSTDANALRDDKGAIYVKAAGNGFEIVARLVDGNIVHISKCVESKLHKLSCANANMDPYNTLPYNIVVGALNAKGKKSSYSTAGSSLWVSAPAGEYGRNNPAIITVDQSGCDKGYSKNGSNTIFNGYGSDNLPHIDNPECNYTSTFNGTSSAAPIVSGAIALMLQANSALTWRDVKHILAKTSDQVDAEIEDTKVYLRNTGKSYIAEPKWLTNAAGYKFHNYYGFGRINVGKAIELAQNYPAPGEVSLSSSFTEDGWVKSATLSGKSIPSYNADGVTDTLDISNDLTIDAIQIKFTTNHTYAGELSVELTSPSGTKSVLLNAYNGFEKSDLGLLDLVLLSNAFYGEKSAGTWTIRIVDPVNIEYESSSNTVHTGALNNWSIKVFGH